MIIKSIELNDYRNYKTLEISLDKRINIFYGKNAQGKTNLLEAAYMSATTKSHRGNKDKEIINIKSEEAHVRTIIEKNKIDYQIDIHLKKNKTKGIAINRVPVKKAGDLFGLLRVIFFSPEDLNIIKNGPLERRRFLDMELCQIDKIYLSDLAKYNKALNQRNKILKDLSFNDSLEETVEIWTSQLVNYGKRIIKKRKDFIDNLSVIVETNYKNITGGNESLKIFYEPNTSIDDYEINMDKSYEKDKRVYQTSVGPHRDDIKFQIGNMDVRTFGSQGQQRSCALALKLSEIELMENLTGEKPVLLLDDVLSELDSDRQKDLVKSLYEVQTLMTCTGMEEILRNNINANRIFYVENATIKYMTD